MLSLLAFSFMFIFYIIFGILSFIREIFYEGSFALCKVGFILLKVLVP